MALIDFATYDEIRAVLGVAETELEDVTVSLPLYGDLLEEELGSLTDVMPALYDTVKALPTPSADQTRFLRRTRLYAAHWVAHYLFGALPQFSPRQITDGKTTTLRVEDPYAHLRTSLPAMLARLRAALLESIQVLDPSVLPTTVAPISVMAAVTLGTDPVTGA